MKRMGLAFDLDGKPLAVDPREVPKIIDAALENDQSKLVLVILELDDELLINIPGPPSRRVLELLQRAVRSYKQVLRGQ
jgi:hypothetical protein